MQSSRISVPAVCNIFDFLIGSGPDHGPEIVSGVHPGHTIHVVLAAIVYFYGEL